MISFPKSYSSFLFGNHKHLTKDLRLLFGWFFFLGFLNRKGLDFHQDFWLFCCIYLINVSIWCSHLKDLKEIHVWDSTADQISRFSSINLCDLYLWLVRDVDGHSVNKTFPNQINLNMYRKRVGTHLKRSAKQMTTQRAWFCKGVMAANFWLFKKINANMCCSWGEELKALLCCGVSLQEVVAVIFYFPNQIVFYMYDIQHCFICRPSYSTVSEDAGIEPRTVASTALTVRRSNDLIQTKYPLTNLVQVRGVYKR